MMRSGRSTTASHKHRLEAEVDRQRHGLDLHQRPDDQGHLEEDGPDQADAVLRREGQRGHADRRPDLRPGHAARVAGLVQGGLDHRARHRRTVRTPSRRPDADRPTVTLTPAGPGSRVRRRGSRPPRRRPGSRARRPPTSAAPSTARSRAPAAIRSWTRSSAQTARSATASRSGSRGSTRIPAAPTSSGSAPTDGGDDRGPDGDRLERGQPGRIREPAAGSPPGRRGPGSASRRWRDRRA